MKIAASSALVLGALLVAGCSGSGPGSGSGSGSGSSASCAAPVVTVSPARVAPGGSITVRGRYFLTDCVDTSVNGEAPRPAPPVTDLPVVLVDSSGARREIARVDAAGELGLVESSVTVPGGVRPGGYRLSLGDARPVAVSVTS